MRSKGVLPAAVLFLLAVMLGAERAQAAIDADPPFPTEGETTIVVVTDEAGNPVRGVEVTAVYRPGSRVARTESLGATRTDGSLTWAPTAAGLVTLTSVGEGPSAQTHNLSVNYRGLPLPGLIILILAGAILYGGVIRGFLRLKSPPPILPPDT